MRFYSSVFFLLIFSFSLNAQFTDTGSIIHDNIERDYRLFRPASYDGTKALPLVFSLHGFGSNALEQQIYTEMGNVSIDNEFLICFPNGVDNAWNVGWTNGSTADDVGFISALIDQLSQDYNIEPNRIYSCGMSNGGYMSYRLACELNDKIAAVASVTGSFSPQYIDQCQPGKSVPTMEIHGTADLVVPYNGAATLAVGVEDVISFWINNNQCELSSDTTIIEDTDNGDFSTAIQVDYKNCDLATQVSLIKIENGGHTWPGASIVVGVTNQDFKASEAIWDFFSQFTLCDISLVSNEDIATESISIFPNPSSSHINIRGNSQQKNTYQIINTQGTIIQNGSVTDGIINIKNIPVGHYFLRFEESKSTRSYPFVKI